MDSERPVDGFGSLIGGETRTRRRDSDDDSVLLTDASENDTIFTRLTSRHVTMPRITVVDPIITDFFARLKAARNGTLILDYDGTLAPFKVDRSAAVPFEGVAESLMRLHRAGHTRLLIVSGRSIADLQPLIEGIPIDEIWGAHGWEKMSDGQYTLRQLDPDAALALKEAGRFVEGQGWEGFESKPASAAFHVRGLEAAEAARRKALTVRAWSSIATGLPLDVHAFDGGIELRPTGFDKGSVVNEILRTLPPGSPAAYLGDDLTDEDAFRAIHGSGLSVLVRPIHRPTLAEAWIRPPVELLQFLNDWHEVLGLRGDSLDT